MTVDFRVTLLGTGVPIPSPERFGPSTLVEAGEQKFLIDAGRGATIRLYQLKIPIGRIDVQLLTHYHSDHTSCLPDVWLTGWLESYFGTRKSMFEQIRPEADQIWADAAVSIPGVLYWASGSAPANKRWSPMDPARSLYRPAPGPLPSWAEPDYVKHNVAEFQRTGFHGGLNYYRAAEPYFYLSGAFKSAKISQPSFFIWGKADGLKELYPLTVDQMRAGLPGLVAGLELDNVGHWVQHEASAVVNEQLVKFLRTVDPALSVVRDFETGGILI